jgi:hypothetical protein
MDFKDLLFTPVNKVFQGGLQQIRDINQRYAEPHIKMNKWVKLCLVALRVYLIVLVGLLFFKFFSSIAK